MVLYGVLLLPIIPSRTQPITARSWSTTRLALYYIGSILFAWQMIMPWIERQIGQHPVIWVIQFLLSDWQRLALCVFWSICIVLAILLFSYLDAKSSNTAVTRTKSELYLRRKFFHLLAILMFAPGIQYQPEFMHLAFSVAICVFFLTEYIRCLHIPPIGTAMNDFLIRFLDHRDKGPVILAHVYLLLGCAIPVWFHLGSPLALMAGLSTLGIGDALASTVGIRFGRYRWPGTNKTIEGTLACIIGVWISPWLLQLSLTNDQWWSMLAVAILSGILECVSEQNDNLLLPPVAFSAIKLLVN
ncbi:hypothetical protein BDF19DRAFT_71765 [Syncephalis fuscata]|nr:hypothetical protein BDF19DRAFT_71765 [Syncephalis fuscata]